MSPCRQLARGLYDFVAAEMPPQLHDALRRHLEICPPCAELVRSYRLTIRLARTLPPVPLPPTCRARLQALLDAEAPVQGERRGLSPPPSPPG